MEDSFPSLFLVKLESLPPAGLRASAPRWLVGWTGDSLPQLFVTQRTVREKGHQTEEAILQSNLRRELSLL